MKIVLTGFMGTGKTSVGKELGKYLGYDFVDTDDLIEEREGMPISLIFKNKGEDYFRSVECAIVEEVSKMNRVIIATGGGVIKNPQNVRNLGNRGIIVWLKADPEIILKRVMLEGGKRPLLDVEEPLQEINKLLTERMPLYKKSDVAVDTNYITPQETAHEIIEKTCLDGEEVRVDLGERSYSILIGSTLLQRLGLRVKEFRPSKVAVVSNKKIFPLYSNVILRSFRENNIEPEIIIIPDGEKYKDFHRAYHIHGELLKARFDRNSILIAFGGGVIGDITGFVASTYMRGIRYVQVPTTLLAQVDSSVGGKTGVNHPLGKNMIGSFHQPSLVMVDVNTLHSLPEREFYAGMSEVIKYGVIADKALFNYLKSDRDAILSLGEGIIKIIKRSCEIKADVVSRDERESGFRAILNFGHTAGHAIETVTGYKKLLHGEAIAVGMCVAAEVAVRMGLLNKQDSLLIKELIELYNLPSTISPDIQIKEIMEAIEIDKKTSAGQIRFVLPESIGTVRIEEDTDRNLIKDVLDSLKS